MMARATLCTALLLIPMGDALNQIMPLSKNLKKEELRHHTITSAGGDVSASSPAKLLRRAKSEKASAIHSQIISPTGEFVQDSGHLMSSQKTAAEEVVSANAVGTFKIIGEKLMEHIRKDVKKSELQISAMDASENAMCSFTPEHRTTIKNVLKYVINTMSQGDATATGVTDALSEPEQLYTQLKDLHGDNFDAVVRQKRAVVTNALNLVSTVLPADLESEEKIDISDDLLCAVSGLDHYADEEEDSEGSGDAQPAHHLVEGDMEFEGSGDAQLVQGGANKSRTLWSGRLWSNKDASGVFTQISYCFDKEIPLGTKLLFLSAIEHYESQIPCIRFEEVDSPGSGRCDADHAIYVQGKHDGGCWSYVGQYETTRLNLDSKNCNSLGIAVHEIGHALGMAHEQSRPDRDEHIKVLWENIQSNRKSNFQESGGADTEISYDLKSVMHYPRKAFSKNGQDTIQEKVQNPDIMLGNRIGLTDLDANQTARMYDCKEVKKLCTHRPLMGGVEEEPCTTNELCSCHLHEYTEGAQNTFKVKEQTDDGKKCWACRDMCPLYGTLGSCTMKQNCICPEAFQPHTKRSLLVSGIGAGVPEWDEGHVGKHCFACATEDQQQNHEENQASRDTDENRQAADHFVALTASPNKRNQQHKCLPKEVATTDAPVVRCCKDGDSKVDMSTYSGCTADEAYDNPEDAQVCQGCNGMRQVIHWEVAKNHCEKHGLRLCTQTEVQSCKTCLTGCMFDIEVMWTSTPCEP
jgi:hypothetical protein